MWDYGKSRTVETFAIVNRTENEETSKIVKGHQNKRNILMGILLISAFLKWLQDRKERVIFSVNYRQ